jgi:hypothetical protein
LLVGNDDDNDGSECGDLPFDRLRGRLLLRPVLLTRDTVRRGAFEADAELGCGFAVAEETESAEIVEVALAAAFGYGSDVVGVPKATASRDGLHPVEMEAGGAGGSAGSFEGVVGRDGVYRADGAYAVVAGEDLIAEVAGIGAETPLVDAVIAAEGAAAPGEDFEIAPAAERQFVGA